MRIRSMEWSVSLAAVLAGGMCLAGGATKPDAKAGKAVYDRDCASCHGATGKGDGDDAAYFTTKPPDFTDPKVLPKRTDDFLSTVITEGGPAKALSKDMPATKLSPPEVKSVVAYLRQLSAPAKGGK